jgi:uncharacterized protein (TIGR03067 family)
MPLFNCPRCRGLNPSVARACVHCGKVFEQVQATTIRTDANHELEGSWRLVQRQSSGVTVPQEHLSGCQLLVTGDTCTLKLPGKQEAFRWHIDPGAFPKIIDWTDARGQTIHGIYEVQGETLRICKSTDSGGRRPCWFAGEEGDLEEWRREGT